MVFGLHASCQRYYFRAGQEKSNLKRSLQKYIKQNSYKTSTIVETDTSILLFLKDSAIVIRADFYYHFNRWSICDVEENITHCSVCLSKNWNEILRDSTYKWQKVAFNKYLSTYSKRKIIEIIDDNNNCPFIKITRVKWNKKEYNALLKGIS